MLSLNDLRDRFDQIRNRHPVVVRNHLIEVDDRKSDEWVLNYWSDQNLHDTFWEEFDRKLIIAARIYTLARDEGMDKAMMFKLQNSG